MSLAGPRVETNCSRSPGSRSRHRKAAVGRARSGVRPRGHAPRSAGPSRRRTNGTRRARTHDDVRHVLGGVRAVAAPRPPAGTRTPSSASTASCWATSTQRDARVVRTPPRGPRSVRRGRPFAAAPGSDRAGCQVRRGRPRVRRVRRADHWTIGGDLVAIAAYSSKPLAGADGYICRAKRGFTSATCSSWFRSSSLGLALVLERRTAGSRRGCRLICTGARGVPAAPASPEPPRSTTRHSRPRADPVDRRSRHRASGR